MAAIPTGMTLAIFAAGRSSRLFGATGGVKALVSVNGQPLIDYTVREARAIGVRRLVVVTNPDGHEIRERLKSSDEFLVEHHVCSRAGTLAAVRTALEAVGARPTILATCDLYGPKGALLNWLNEALAMDADVVIGLSEMGLDSDPIGVKLDSRGIVQRYGKSVRDTPARAVGLRLFRQNPILRVPGPVVEGVSTDSELMAWIVDSQFFRVAGLDCPGIFDVDTDRDLAMACALAQSTEGWYAEK